jgi:hypothetical protein
VQTDRTNPNNKPDIITCNNEKGICMLIDVAVSGGRTVIEKEAQKILNYKDLPIEIQCMWNVKNNCDTGNNRGNWDDLKITNQIPLQYSMKAQNEGTRENSCIWHCTHTSESTTVKAQEI